MQKKPVICIFDFFGGTGYDVNRIPGSPIRILEMIRRYMLLIFQNRVKVHFYLNEFEPDRKDQRKFALLKDACTRYLEQQKDLNRAVQIHYYNEDCETLLPKLLPVIEQHPSLVYLDQNGVKFLAGKYLMALEKMAETDFLYFVSSSYTWRFGDSPEFQAHLDLDFSEIRQNPYKFIHRSLIAGIKKKLPAGSALKLYPFSIKKGANIHGIIFGATHPRAVDKFLNLAWGKNELNGEANFDIDDDAKKTQVDIWGARNQTKIERFKDTVRKKVLAGEIKSNADLLHFVFAEGHVSRHAAEVLREMKKSGALTYDAPSPLVTYENVYKNKRILEYKLLGISS